MPGTGRHPLGAVDMWKTLRLDLADIATAAPAVATVAPTTATATTETVSSTPTTTVGVTAAGVRATQLGGDAMLGHHHHNDGGTARHAAVVEGDHTQLCTVHRTATTGTAVTTTMDTPRGPPPTTTTTTAAAVAHRWRATPTAATTTAATRTTAAVVTGRPGATLGVVVGTGEDTGSAHRAPTLAPGCTAVEAPAHGRRCGSRLRAQTLRRHPPRPPQPRTALSESRCC